MWGDGCFSFLESLLLSAFTYASFGFKLPILSYEPFLPLHYTIIDQTRQRADTYWGLERSGKKGRKHSKGGGSDWFALTFTVVMTGRWQQCGQLQRTFVLDLPSITTGLWEGSNF